MRKKCAPRKKKQNLVKEDIFVEDKLYLRQLVRSVKQNVRQSPEVVCMGKVISQEAEKTLTFLETREDFWKQIELSKMRKNRSS